MTTIWRLILTLCCLSVAGFSIFGFLASFEPGISPAWKIGYAVLFGLCLMISAAPWKSESH